MPGRSLLSPSQCIPGRQTRSQARLHCLGMDMSRRVYPDVRIGERRDAWRTAIAVSDKPSDLAQADGSVT